MKKFILIICLCFTAALLLIACSDKNRENPETEITIEPQVFEGRYFDEGVYQYIDIPEAESPLIYCEILVSNVTDTSFDFIIQEKVMATGESKSILSKSTAYFEKDGTKAVFQGEEQTLYFTFPDEKDIYPKHMQIQGLKQTEGKSYLNNTIPGHESG